MILLFNATIGSNTFLIYHSKAEVKVVKTRLVNSHVACLTFLQKTGV